MALGSRILPGNKPVKTYTALASAYRLQLKALEDGTDPRSGRRIHGETEAAQFKDGIFRTNDPWYIEEIEKSQAFNDGSVADLDKLRADAKEKAFKDLMSMATSNPDMAERLAKELSKRKSEIEEPEENKTKKSK